MVLLSYMEYLTIPELAQYLKLSRMMIYKLAQKGELPGRKVGRVWRFPKDSIDRWMGAIPSAPHSPVISPPVDTILTDYVRQLRKTFQSRLKLVVLFGSHARGDATLGSDIDTLVVLDFPKSKDESKVWDIAYAATYGADRLQLLSAIVVGASEYRAGKTPLLMNIRSEGKILYESEN